MTSNGLRPPDRAYLLKVARIALEAEVRGDVPPPPPDDVPHMLVRHAGVFVSVYRGNELRGCIGYVAPRWPLVEAVARAARAATRDRRFQALDPDDLSAVWVEVSILSALAVIHPDEVQVGTHGLAIDCGDDGSGLLLPQVALTHGWDRITFLDQLCRKAGLPPGRWRRDDALLRAFTAEVFSDFA